MRERVLFVPAWFNSPQSCYRYPGLRALLTALESTFDLDIYHWPTVKGGPDAPPTWQGNADALRSALQPGIHVVDSGTGTALLMLALTRQTEVRSFTAPGLVTPPATLRSLAMDSLADAAEFVFSMLSSQQYVRLLMQGATEAQWADAASVMDDDVNWPYARELTKSMPELSLVNERVHVDVPALYLDTPLTVAGFAEMREVFLRFVPGAETGELKLWPVRMQDQDAGYELAAKVTEFIGRVAARNAAASA